MQPFHAAGVREMVMSENGRFVAFSSAGSGNLRQLVPNFIDDNGPLLDLYVRDLQASTTRLVSRQYTDPKRGSPAGVETTTGESPGVFSADGTSAAVCRRVRAADPQRHHRAQPVRLPMERRRHRPGLREDGRVDRRWPGPPSTSLPSPPRSASRSPPTASFAAFSASTTQGDLTGEGTSGRKNVYVRDLRAAAAPTTLVSLTTSGLGGNGDSTHPVISRNGAVVVFESLATDLVDNFIDGGSFIDIFARPMSGPNRAGPVEWLTRDAVLPAGGNQSAALEDVSADGRYVAWRSTATNYVHFTVVSDTNSADDVFVRDRVAGGPVSIKSVVPVGTPATANAASGSSTLLPSGQAAFFSDATNLLDHAADRRARTSSRRCRASPTCRCRSPTRPTRRCVGQQVVYTFTVANARASGGNRGRAERARARRRHGALGGRRRDAERRRRQVRPGNAERRRDQSPGRWR